MNLIFERVKLNSKVMKKISDYTEREFLELVCKICRAVGPTEKDDSPEGIVQEVKEWRLTHGKPGFKP